MSIRYTASVAALLIGIGASPAFADMDAAKRWIDTEFQPSTLSKEDQMKEMEWFINAAKPFQGMEINVLSEDIPTHHYEAEVLAKAFEEITGIKVNHQILGEGEVVQAVQTQMQTNRNLYDGYINDFDLIGTHSRLQSAVNLTDWMAGEGKDVTDPDARHRRLHGQVVHHRAGRQALAVARPAVRQPLLVPQGLVRPPGPQGPSSRPSTATILACRSTGRPMRTSPTSSPTT